MQFACSSLGPRLGFHDGFIRQDLTKFTVPPVMQSAPVISKLSLTATFPAVEIGVAVLAQFRLRPALVLRGMLYDRDQGRSVWRARIGARNSWVR
jgi:hypothetical protein